MSADTVGASAGGAASSAHHRRATTSRADPWAYLEAPKNDTQARLDALKDATVVEATYTNEERQQIEELRRLVAEKVNDPQQMVATPEDYPGGMHVHWTTWWPAGKDHPRYVDTVSHLDRDSTRWPDHELHRFLKARDFNMKKAVKMYFHYRRWRIIYGASHLATFPTMPFEPLIQSILSHSYHTLDKHGRPVYLQRSGLIDPERFSTEVSLEMIGIGHTWFSEEMAKRRELGSRLTGKRVTKIANVIDVKGLGLGARKMIKIFGCTSYIDQNFYPETLGCLYLINVPSFFPAIFALCKSFLSEETQRKIKILSAANVSATLIEDLGIECVPTEYGGQCQCPGGCCPAPTGRDYVRPGEEDAVEETLAIKAGAKLEHDMLFIHAVPTEDGSGQELQEMYWTIELPAKDIDFSVTFLPTDDAAAAASSAAAIEVSPVTRIHSSMPTTAVYSNPTHSGTLRFTFDNTYSRWTSKHVKLRSGMRIKLQPTAAQ